MNTIIQKLYSTSRSASFNRVVGNIPAAKLFENEVDRIMADIERDADNDTLSAAYDAEERGIQQGIADGTAYNENKLIKGESCN